VFVDGSRVGAACGTTACAGMHAPSYMPCQDQIDSQHAEVERASRLHGYGASDRGVAAPLCTSKQIVAQSLASIASSA